MVFFFLNFLYPLIRVQTSTSRMYIVGDLRKIDCQRKLRTDVSITGTGMAAAWIRQKTVCGR